VKSTPKKLKPRKISSTVRAKPDYNALIGPEPRSTAAHINRIIRAVGIPLPRGAVSIEQYTRVPAEPPAVKTSHSPWCGQTPALPRISDIAVWIGNDCFSPKTDIQPNQGNGVT
jgi:hypothetical protein